MTMQETTKDPRGSENPMAPEAPFRRMLVAIDQSEAAQGAFDFACEWVGQHGADVWFVQLTDERRRRHSGFETDMDPMDVEPANHVVVSGRTLGARNRQLVHGLAEAATAFRADVIVLGFGHSRLVGHRLAPSLREQITRASELPVLVVPAHPHRTSRLRLVPGFDHTTDAHAMVRPYANV